LDTKYLKNVLTGFLISLLSAGLIFYLIYHMLNLFEDKLSTVPATLTSVYDQEDFTGYVMRNERLIYAYGTGSVAAVADNGEKVRVTQELAHVYKSTNMDLQERISAIDEQIALLEDAAEQSLSAKDTYKIDSLIDESLLRIRENTAEGSISGAASEKRELLTQITKRSLIESSVVGYDTLITALKSERTSLENQLSGIAETVYSAYSGYYFFETDGYESIFSASLAEKMTLTEFDAMLASDPDPLSGSKGTCVGKIVTSSGWYLACPATKENLRYYTEGNSYQIFFSHNSERNITMTLDRIISQTDRDDIVLVFYTDVMPADFSYARSQEISIAHTLYEGYKLPQSAIRLSPEGVKGVYVLEGTTVHFRRITILLETDGYYIVGGAPEGYEGTERFIGINDNVVIEGRDLYDGKIVA